MHEPQLDCLMQWILQTLLEVPTCSQQHTGLLYANYVKNRPTLELAIFMLKISKLK